MAFLREVFSEEGQGSFSRVASGLHVAAALAWITHIVWRTHILPDPATLAAVSGFVIAPYGANKFANAIGNLGGKSGPQS